MALLSLAALLAVLSLPSAAEGQLCTSARIAEAKSICDGNLARSPQDQDASLCHARLDSLWLGCMSDERKKGEPFPPPLRNTANPARAVLNLRNQYGLPTRDTLVAAGDKTLDHDADPPNLTPAELAAEEAKRREVEDTVTLAGQPGGVIGNAADRLKYQASDSALVGGSELRLRSVITRQRQSQVAAEQTMTPDAGQLAGKGLVVSANAGLRLEQQLGSQATADDLRVIAAAHRDAGDTAGAGRAAQRLLEKDPEDIGALRDRAVARSRSGDSVGALADARRVLAKEPGDEIARGIVGSADDLARSGDKLKKASLDFGPDREAEGGAGGGAAGARTGAFTAALAEAPLDLDRRPFQIQQLWKSALRRAGMGDFTGALRDATRLTVLEPRDHRVWVLRSRISAKLKNWPAVEADAKQALALKPEDPAALLELGYAMFQQGRAAEGLATIDRALALEPRLALGQLYRAEALEALGRKAEALAAYKLAVSLDPALAPLVADALARLEPRAAGSVAPPLPAWRKTYRVVTAVLATLFLLTGLRFLIVARRRGTASTTSPPVATEPGREPVAGDILGGNFRVEKELARGGMGVVYLAVDVTLKRRVAIKRLKREAHESDDARRKFLQEAQLAARLKHPNLAQIHSVFGERELYLVFELVDGEGLDAVLARRKHLDLKETRAVVTQVCRALEHAHAGRVIHRDLKPANVMLDKDGTCKVMDFGIAHQARTLSSPTQTQAWGTPPYMAPEQEDGQVSPASDLYALGVMTYELLAGRRPFDGPGQYGLKRSGTFAKLGGTVGLPHEVDRFFEKALHPDATKRFATAAQFSAAFAELAGTPVRG